MSEENILRTTTAVESVSPLRLPAALLLAALTTFAIAWLMRTLIEPPFAVIEEQPSMSVIPFVRLPEDPPKPPVRRKADPPPPVARPPAVTPVQGEQIGYGELTFEQDVDHGPQLTPAVLLADGDVMSLVQARPVYPESAKRRGAEGYVVVEFVVQASGGVANARVVEAHPRGVFDRAALAAVSRSRYRPRVVDGQPVTTPGLRTRLTFTLE
ncbi:MAG: energy transducer TonB [Pseudomonadota bacterium]